MSCNYHVLLQRIRTNPRIHACGSDVEGIRLNVDALGEDANANWSDGDGAGGVANTSESKTGSGNCRHAHPQIV